MTLSAIELMDLSDKLDALMSKAATASGMELLDISDEIGEPAEFGKNRTLRFSGHP